MFALPRDSADLQLAPVALAVEARIVALGQLSPVDLARTVAQSGIGPTENPEHRAAGLVHCVQSGIAMHGWHLSMDERGLRLSHGEHSLVLGLPASLQEFIALSGAGAHFENRNV